MHDLSTDLLPLWRILDAATNRAAEGLRVAEDYVRFGLDDAHLTGQFKQLRHELTGLVARLEVARRHAARNTQLDVGTQETLASEANRRSLRDVFAAAAARAQQAIRSLEEYSKLFDAELSAQFEALRYRSYTLASATINTTESRRRLEDAQLCVLVDGANSLDEFTQRVEAICAAGAPLIQLRDKQLADVALLARARRLVEVAHRHGRLAIVNDRPDVAAAAQADGVHLGQDDLTVKDARQVLGPDALVGVSTHSLEQARTAVLDGASYIGVGPVFPSSTKPFEEFVGVELVGQVAAEIRLPAFAIGGVTRDRLAEIQQAGLDRVAVSGAVAAAVDPADEVRQLIAQLAGEATLR
ncbi:MAG: thiamine phosphate synthase [Planctomycetota bacterium]|nr:MAG: thiamine phosphate synthase [Planctomycetota bacterium]REK39436.1 MAG: thiamine phosphate synthase [Planctomycetota bacterium]